MLRLAVIVLLLANAGYYAWTQGVMHPLGFEPQDPSEPQRLEQQIRPETLRILKASPSPSPSPSPSAGADPSDAAAPVPPASPSAPAPADAPAATAPANSLPLAATAALRAPDTECLQAGVFDERQAEALRTAAANLPQGSWVLDATPLPGRWMVYMGRFDDVATLNKKRTELRALQISVDRAGGSLEYGLSLGRFSSRSAAERELASVSARGVRSARVVQERPDTPGFVLRLPAVTEALRPQLSVLRTALAGKTLRACSP